MEDAFAPFFNITDPPEVEVVRWILPEEATTTRLDCVADRGFRFADDGSYDVPAELTASLNLAEYECWMAYPILPEYGGAWGPEQIEAQYDYTVDFLIPCLESEGFTISSVPSRGAFIDSWNSAPFYPYEQVIQRLQSSTNELERICPQIGPASVIWDGQPASEYSVPK